MKPYHLGARIGSSILLAAVVLFPSLAVAQEEAAQDPAAQRKTYELNDNGAWSWFMDERVIVDNGKLIVGSVRANGNFRDRSATGWGNIELGVLDLATGATRVVVLHQNLEQDDHNNPGLLVLPDGRYFAAYSKHSQETKLYYRISIHPGDPYEWGPVREFVTPGEAKSFGGDSVTYCNPIRLSEEDGRIYLLHRGVGNDPNYLISEDNGESWKYGGRLFIGRDGYSPYAKYISDGRKRIHFVATEDHPRNFDNNLFHGYLEGGKFHGSDGKVIGDLSDSQETSLRAWDFTKFYEGGPANVAWMTDIHLDKDEHPVVLFTTQRDGEGLPRKQGGMDHRFHLARWDGQKWESEEIAYAGKRLYPGEDDYTGLGAIDPQNTHVVAISTDAHPSTGEPLISKADGNRHHELFIGKKAADGGKWEWEPLTSDSNVDHMRPLIPIRDEGEQTIVVWMQGTYHNNRGEWTSKVMATVVD